MSELNHINTPCSQRQFLTRDQCIEIRALRRLGNLSIRQIAATIHVSVRQVRYACNRADENPRTSSGRPPTLSTQQADELEAYIKSSPAAREMSYLRLADGPFNHWNRGECAIRGALERRGYRRCLVPSKSLSGKGGKVLKWETRKTTTAKGTKMTRAEIERYDIDRREISDREGVGTIVNGGVNANRGPREGIDMISRENGGNGQQFEISQNEKEANEKLE